MRAWIASSVLTAAAWLAPMAHGQESPPSPAELQADRSFTTQAYAHEFGSGVYDFNGTTVQVYRIPLEWAWREPLAGRPGIAFTLPLTVGFADFRTGDDFEFELPDRIDALSLVPGVEFIWPVGEYWRVRPYVQAGATLSDLTDVDALLYGTGVRADYERIAGAERTRFRLEGIYSAVDFDGLPDDYFVRLRGGSAFAWSLPWAIGDGRLEAGVFSLFDVYADPPTGPATGVDVPTTQFEAGITLATRPQWRIGRIPVPGIGLSYRFAGAFSAWRLVIGAPF